MVAWKGREILPGDLLMTQLCQRSHFDRRALARLNEAVVLGLVGGGLLACVIGAFVFDVGHWFFAW